MVQTAGNGSSRKLDLLLEAVRQHLERGGVSHYDEFPEAWQERVLRPCVP